MLQPRDRHGPRRRRGDARGGEEPTSIASTFDRWNWARWWRAAAASNTWPDRDSLRFSPARRCGRKRAPVSGRLARVGVLLSGRGSNFLALDDAMRRCEVPADVVLVASNLTQRRGSRASPRARPADGRRRARGSEPRQAQEGRDSRRARGARVEWICLAGYMRLLSATFVRAHRERILNVHPSLLPAFPGLHAQRQAPRARGQGGGLHRPPRRPGARQRGDHRAARGARPRRGRRGELSARILEQEHVAYPEALRRLLTERWRVEGRRVRFEPG